MIQSQSRYVPFLSLVLAMLLWASSFIVMKLAIRHYDPIMVVFGRMSVASLCFLFFINQFRRSLSFRKKDLKYILIMAFCEPCLYYVFEAKAIEHTTASQAGMVTAVMPLMVAGAAHIFLKEYIAKKALLGFALAILGVCWLSVGGKPSETSPNPPLGNFLEALAMICATGYTITLKRLTLHYSPFFLTAVQAFAGSIFFLFCLFLPTTTLPTRFELISVLAIIYLGAFITMGAYGLYNFGISKIPASQASAFVNLIPVFAIIMGWLILGEQFTSDQYFAALLVFAGVFISQGKTELGMEN